MSKGIPGEWWSNDQIGGYFDEDGDLVVCEEYDLTDVLIDRYVVLLEDGDGFYDDDGKYVFIREL